MPAATGCLGLRRAGGVVAATRTGFVFLDTRDGSGSIGVRADEAFDWSKGDEIPF